MSPGREDPRTTPGQQAGSPLYESVANLNAVAEGIGVQGCRLVW